jgi:Berberine and berberine like
VLGDEASGAELLAPLRALGPVMDTFAMVPPAGIAELHMDPPEPVPYAGEGMMLGALDHGGIDAFVAAAGAGSGSTLVSAEIRHVGGALARPTADQGALGTLDAQFLTYALGIAADDAMVRATRQGLVAVAGALAPYDNGRQYLNFTDATTDPAHFFRPGTYHRLRRLKAAWDPEQLFRANHSILPA